MNSKSVRNSRYKRIGQENGKTRVLQFKTAENGRTQAMGQYEMRKC